MLGQWPRCARSGRAPSLTDIGDLSPSALSCCMRIYELLHKTPELRRGCVTGYHLVIANACPPQCFLLDRIASGGGSLMMCSALIFDCMPRLTVLVHEK